MVWRELRLEYTPARPDRFAGPRGPARSGGRLKFHVASRYPLLYRLIATMQFGVTPLDALTFAAVTIVLALTAAVAIAGPAWRAARVDPAVALRTE